MRRRLRFRIMLVIALLVPTVFTPVPLHWIGDIITVIYLFALGRFFIALAGLDTGSAFGGLGSSREMSIASIVEPAMMLAIFTASVTAGSTNLSIVVERLSASPLAMMNPAHLLAFAGVHCDDAETGRIGRQPGNTIRADDDPRAMVLEYWRYLALSAGIADQARGVFALLSNMFFPVGMAATWSPRR
jgi:formate hydrogenlyase subunit 4